MSVSVCLCVSQAWLVSELMDDGWMDGWTDGWTDSRAARQHAVVFVFVSVGCRLVRAETAAAAAAAQVDDDGQGEIMTRHRIRSIT